MCGIAGFFDQQNIDQVKILRAMLDSQFHRGPDAEGCWFDLIENRRVALGHRRLSILDVSDKANQPMTYQHLTIVYNGEVYNFAEIRSELQKAGYDFQTDGDTEVILKAFHQWNIAAINKFRGMFSFCILDKEAKKAYLVRDRVGTKPLYYYHDSHIFIFSSEIQALRYHPCFKSVLCEQGMNLFFQYSYIASPSTIFKGTRKVRPGHYIEYDIVHHAYVEKQYWDLAPYYLLPKFSVSEAEATEQLQNLLIESFSLRMISDVPVGVLLSGGIDSSLVASILQSHASQPIDTFTISFNQKEYDESSYARKIAEHLGTHHHEKLCAWQDAESIIGNLPKIYGEPFADTSAIPTTLLSKFAKQKVTVALSGDGGDELFCGYSSYLLNNKRFQRLDKIPFKNALSTLLNLVPDTMMGLYQFNYDLYSRYLKLKSLFASDHIEDKYMNVTRTFTQYDLNKLFLNRQSLFSIKKEIFPEMNSLERMMLIDFNHYLPDNLMVKVDRASMYYSLEGREPLLDHKILEFAAQLSIQLKQKKNILKKVLEKYLPLSYFDRTKQGFGVPIHAWLRNELGYLVRQYLDPVKIKRQAIFNEKYVTQLCQSFMRSKTNDNRIWTLLVFQMWYQEYFNEEF